MVHSIGVDGELLKRITEKEILNLVPNQDVYIMTGTFGVKSHANGLYHYINNRVTVPDSFWKAVCYPGNSTHNPWGYAIIGRNTDGQRLHGYDEYMTLKTFSKYFVNGPFNSTCLNANLPSFYYKFHSKEISYKHV